MNNKKTEKDQNKASAGPNFAKYVLDESWTYIKTLIDIVHEPIIILDEDLRVRAANDSFYRKFQVEARDTEGKNVYALGNGQWNIPALKKLLEDILPKNTFFKGFEVSHEFPFIGRKVMILNARQIHFKENPGAELFPRIILLAIEDITEIMMVAETVANHANILEAKLSDKARKLEIHIGKLEKEVNDLKKAVTPLESNV